MSRITSHEELDVYQMALSVATDIFNASQEFPAEELHSLVEPIRNCSRMVCASISEAWRKRRTIEAFVSSLNEAEAKAGETQSWIRIASECGYLRNETTEQLMQECDHVIGKLVRLISNPEPWIIRRKP
jgi:four helix bundle protein